MADGRRDQGIVRDHNQADRAKDDPGRPPMADHQLPPGPGELRVGDQLAGHEARWPADDQLPGLPPVRPDRECRHNGEGITVQDEQPAERGSTAPSRCCSRGATRGTPIAATIHVMIPKARIAPRNPTGWIDPVSRPITQSPSGTTPKPRWAQTAPNALPRRISQPLRGVEVRLTQVSSSRSTATLEAEAPATRQ